jgi:putative Mg2+ transporter-C (MgtC) family protein
MSEMDVVIKLVLACICGGVIGYLREKERKAAGLRTHMLVCSGSTLIMLVSIYMALNFPGADPTRIASNVIVGIGFIGAGAIIQAGASIIGITTAASIWVAAAIGLALGCGFYFGGIAATIIAVIILKMLHEFEKKYIRGGEQ